MVPKNTKSVQHGRKEEKRARTMEGNIIPEVRILVKELTASVTSTIALARESRSDRGES